MVRDAREFLLAIKESTHVAFDADAAEFLDDIRTYMSRQLDHQGVTGDARDSIFFFEGMLRGTQIRVKRQEHESKGRLNALGLLTPDGDPKLPEM
jgi:hypothetical protein